MGDGYCVFTSLWPPPAIAVQSEIWESAVNGARVPEETALDCERTLLLGDSMQQALPCALDALPVLV